MGALTLKNFPFNLRGWDIEKFESIDPTDSFGSQTRVYISKDQIVQIEPDYNVNTFNTWLTDKGRQYFDSIFGVWSLNNKTDKNKTLSKKHWNHLIKKIIKTLYFFDHCNQLKSKNYFFTIVIGNLSLEILSLLLMFSKNYSFIKLKKFNNINLNSDFELNFQLNSSTKKIKLNSSTLCLLLSTNTRYEGYQLNLNLRQRFLKGNFKCLGFGSLLNLTFPIEYLGSNIKDLKKIIGGNHLICQDFKFAKNPIIILNSELFKRQDGNSILTMLKTLEYYNIINKSWIGIDILSSTLAETGTYNIANFLPITKQDLNNFSSLYFLNVTLNNLTTLKKITETKLLNFNQNRTVTNIPKLLLDQSVLNNKNLSELSKTLNLSYYYLPISMFYENEETYINTEGFIKRTNKFIFRKKTRNNWQIIRKLFKKFNTSTFIQNKNNNLIFFNSKKLTSFKTFIYFYYQATQSLTNLNFYLNITTLPFKLTYKYQTFKPQSYKINNTKIQYWLNDLFCGGKDEYSYNSLIMTYCSKILRTESTNFF